MKLAVLALILLGVACGDNTPRPPATPDAPGAPDAPDAPTVTTPASFCRAFSERICAGLDACACRFDQRAYDAAGCADARTADCVASFGAKVGPDLAAGHARFDEAVVASCLAATDAMVAG
ncbi:MAG: hypothetical protein NT062_10020, partial [Proteobacteria bacterium]|nr:hypothetical protein [Pseudomonadota bacterium]